MMGAIIAGIIVLLLVAELFDKYPAISALVLGSVIAIFFVYMASKSKTAQRAMKEKEERELREKEEAERQQEEYKRQRFENEQAGYRKEIFDSIESANIIKKSFPLAIKDANVSLNKAETEYVNGAFAPFWDAVESALKSLAGFDSDARVLKNKFLSYMGGTKLYREKAPDFPDVLSSMPSAEPTIERLNGIVYQAQKNYQFASIYEQRKTNKILIAGFSSLGQALANLGDILQCSVRDLKDTFEMGMAELRSATDAAANRLLNAVDEFKSSNEAASNGMVSEIQGLRKQVEEESERSIEMRKRR